MCLVTALLLSLPRNAEASAARRLTVSLTFDDGSANQLIASRILDKYDMRGTFYINSGLVGLPGYMAWEDLDGLKAHGHEIGGHTVTHADLTTLSASEANRQICQDRQTLLSWGFDVSSFAYPFSAFKASVEGIAQRCGYRTARAVGSLKSPRSCAECPVTERLPPVDLYATRTPDDIDMRWSLADLRNTVTRAESSGGWLTFNFHHVCDSCSPSSIRPAVFERFIAWLKARSPTSARTTVRTVQQVITGATKPAVAATPPRPPGAPGRNSLRNHSLEVASSTDSTLPHCWTLANSGVHRPRQSRTTDAHAGTFAAKITMPNGTDGDAKLIPTLDLGDCSPSVTRDHIYEVSAWYRSNTEVYFTLYQRDAVGQWAYWTQSPPMTAAKGWTKATWITPPVSSDTVAVSVGLTIDSPGTLTVDDLSFVDETPPAARPPTPPAAEDADRIDYTAYTDDQSDAGGWPGIVCITIALIALVAGMLDSYRTKAR